MISTTQKLVFIHQIRTGGTAILKALDSICHFENYHRDNGMGPNQGFSPIKHKKHATIQEHIDILKGLNEDPKKYYYVTTVRNPWDWYVSRYEYSKNNPMNPKGFRKWFRGIYNMKRSPWHGCGLYNKNNSENIKIQKYLRFERLEKDYNQLVDELNLSDKVNSLPKLNQTERTKQGISYREYHDDFSRDKIAEIEHWLIDTFEYIY